MDAPVDAAMIGAPRAAGTLSTMDTVRDHLNKGSRVVSAAEPLDADEAAAAVATVAGGAGDVEMPVSCRVLTVVRGDEVVTAEVAVVSGGIIVEERETTLEGVPRVTERDTDRDVDVTQLGKMAFRTMHARHAAAGSCAAFTHDSHFGPVEKSLHTHTHRSDAARTAAELTGVASVTSMRYV